jgi:hypothetical protein
LPLTGNSTNTLYEAFTIFNSRHTIPLWKWDWIGVRDEEVAVDQKLNRDLLANLLSRSLVEVGDEKRMNMDLTAVLE